MPSLSDIMLAGGCASHVEAIHGELVKILTGPDAGKSFVCVRENESDIILSEGLGEDARAKRVIRFRDGNVPVVRNQEQVQTEDGQVWIAVRAPQDGYLSTDFELKKVEGIDQV
jgi:hypothetical protein